MQALKNYANTDWPSPAIVVSDREKTRVGRETWGMTAFVLMCFCALNLLFIILSGFLPDERALPVSLVIMMSLGLPAGLSGAVIGAMTFDTRWGGRTVIITIALIIAATLGVAGMVLTPPHNQY